ncbi:unnamed protein product [Acanthoscelides obtectus]|uniref:Vitellogenin domain-containing protein n=2 Tax=Acanthoscelides obtectus TaxID=200917 RepID=A0A9P0PAQ4_ACAOB|nr:unnamed protein product [Acanthoscelides obtectus]CAK1638197.1 Microsomal triglyceride transfer protein large subunit [Acanthoscelides obtectus]
MFFKKLVKCPNKMLPSISSYSFLYTLFAWLLGFCYGFVLLSSAAGHNAGVRLFDVGSAVSYKLHSTLLFDENEESTKDVGFYIDADVVIEAVWENDEQRLLKIELKSPRLHIKSRKAPTPDGFIPHWSKLEELTNKPFLMVWKNGKIEKILLAKTEEVSMVNLKKGFASLLQIQLSEGTVDETDASGKCTATYTSQSSTKIVKTKSNCTSDDFYRVNNPHEFLRVNRNSFITVEYEADSSKTYLNSIVARENHVMYLPIKEDIACRVKSEQILSYVSSEKIRILEASTVEEAIESISKTEGLIFTQETLLTERESLDEETHSFTKQVDSLRGYLDAKDLGSLKPAKAFIKLVTTARRASKDDISKALSSKKNKGILLQLYDILGYAQTKDSHEAVMKSIHLDNENQIEVSERYLWATSFSSQPNPDIAENLLKQYKKLTNIPPKIQETLVLTLGSMAYKLGKLPDKKLHVKIIRDIEETILNNLDYAKGENKFVFFRALKNLHSPSTITVLLNYVTNGTQKEGVLAWKAIKAFGPDLWDERIQSAAVKAFFQLDRKYDSSSRTLAADILIESQPNDRLLEDILNFLIGTDPAYEVKQYANRKIGMLADEDNTIRARVQKIIRKNPKLNNYHGLAPRGLSLALTRRFMSNPYSNGSLVTVQEMKSGIAKRGTVDVVLDKHGFSKELFSVSILYIFIFIWIETIALAQQVRIPLITFLRFVLTRKAVEVAETSVSRRLYTQFPTGHRKLPFQPVSCYNSLDRSMPKYTSADRHYRYQMIFHLDSLK